MTDCTVADICTAVGLSSVGSFTTTFHRVYGQPPTVYRAAAPPASAYAVVPARIVHAFGRPQNRTFREDSVRERSLTSSVSPRRQGDDDVPDR